MGEHSVPVAHDFPPNGAQMHNDVTLRVAKEDGRSMAAHRFGMVVMGFNVQFC